MSFVARLGTSARLVSRTSLASSLAARIILPAHRVAGVRMALPAYRSASTAAAFAPKQTLSNDAEVPANAEEIEEVEEEVTAIQFDTIADSIHPDTYKALTRGPFRYTDMSPVQAEVLSLLPDLAQPYDPEAKGGPARDLLVKAKTGTGKTIAFLVPAIEARLNKLQVVAKEAEAKTGLRGPTAQKATDHYAKENVGTLVISPTRELAIQIANEAMKLTKYHGHGIHLFVGGERKDQQLRQFKYGRKDIVVATPGRLLDIFENSHGILPHFQNLHTLVLDEGDTLLDMGFRSDIESIISNLPPTPERQTVMFSATVSPAIRQVVSAALDKNHKFIDCVPINDSPVHAHIPQHCTVVPSAADQIPHVMHLIAQDQLQHPGTSKIILFCNTTKTTALFGKLLGELKQNLPDERTQLYELHSKVSQASRRNRSDRFRQARDGCHILVTSDVSARGVDYPDVTRVIQVGAPSTPDQYVHRIGRTGRGKNKTGRGDFVLLPFEAAYPKQALPSVTLKSNDIATTESELLALAEQYDADPSAFFKSTPELPARRFNARDARGRPQQFGGPRPYRKGVKDRLQELPKAIETAALAQPAEDLNNMFASLVGFYLSNAVQDLNLKGMDVLAACQEWCNQALKYDVPPLSASLMEKLGLNAEVRRERKNMDFGKRGGGASQRFSRSPSRSSSANPWYRPEGRGGSDAPRRSSGFRGGDKPWEQRGSRGGDKPWQTRDSRGGDSGFQRRSSSPRRDWGQRSEQGSD